MLDHNLFLNDFELTSKALLRKGISSEMIEEARDAIQKRRECQQETEVVRADLNKNSKMIGELIRKGEKAQAEDAKKAVEATKAKLHEKEAELKSVEDAFHQCMLHLPNLPRQEVPEGLTEEQNVVIREHGYDAEHYKGKEFKPHWEVADQLKLLDSQRAAKLCGSMFTIYCGDGAKLLRALVQFALDINRDRYEELVVPHFVRSHTLESTGHLPKFAEDAFHMPEDDLWAIPTGEVPLTALHANEILDFSTLPLRYMAYTSCFRREAGSAGKDTRGLQRLHEFHKVELVHILPPELEEEGFNGLLADCERTLQQLELPYRVLELCAGDLTFSSSKIYDLEVYSPGVDRWLECSSVGMFSDFQARRAGIRFRRDKKSKPEIAYTLNGSGLATPRVMAAILEHGLQEDGTVKLPEVLHDYMKKSHLSPRG